VTINDDSAGAPGSHTFHAAAWDGERDFVVAWLDERQAAVSPAAHAGHVGANAHTPAPDEEGDATVFLARSRDFGATWERANQPKWGAACPCCRVALARAPDGRVRAAWRKHFPVNVRDVVAGPLDGGDSTQVLVHADGWVFPGCPHTGPAAAVDGRGATHVAWFTGAEGAVGIRHARAAAGAASFDSARFVLQGRIGTAHVAIAGLPGGGSVVAFDRDADGAARLVVAMVDPAGRPGQPVALAGSVDVDHPTVTALDEGTALVAWTRQSSAGSRVFLARVRLRS
jgi:hypothetical protein